MISYLSELLADSNVLCSMFYSNVLLQIRFAEFSVQHHTICKITQMILKHIDVKEPDVSR